MPLHVCKKRFIYSTRSKLIDFIKYNTNILKKTMARYKPSSILMVTKFILIVALIKY